MAETPCIQLGSCPFPLKCSSGYSVTKTIRLVTFINIDIKKSVSFTDCEGNPQDKILSQGSRRISETTIISVSYSCSCPGGRTTCVQYNCNNFNNQLRAHSKKVEDAIKANTFTDSNTSPGANCPPVKDNCGRIIRPGRTITRTFTTESKASAGDQICTGNGCSC
jgi:hypothetical protein